MKTELPLEPFAPHILAAIRTAFRGCWNELPLDNPEDVSRTRNKLWMKGETSGNRLAVRQVFVDCDEDTVLIKVRREGDGNVCHTGQRSCFYTVIENAQVEERR